MLEDSPERKVVELEMLTSWRFLFLSGEFSVNLKLTQDRPNCKVWACCSWPPHALNALIPLCCLAACIRATESSSCV